MGRTKRQHHIVRLFALALCLLLTLTALPGHASALTGTTGGLNWTLWGGTLTVSGTGAMPNYSDVNRPPWYDSAQFINRIVVEEGVTTVGTLAFLNCSKAVRVILPSTMTAIKDRAFKNCTALTYVNLPEGLTSIGEAAFERCESLNGIFLPESLRTIGNFAFERCVSLTGIVIPAGVTRLGMVVFYHCTGLTRAVIRCPIEKIPDWLFYGCTALTAVELPATVTETGDRAFHSCESLSVVYYSGPAAEDISNALWAEPATSSAMVSDNGGEPAPTTSSSTFFDRETATTTTVTVTQTEGVVITETTKTGYTYTVNGEEATVQEALAAVETEEVETIEQTSIVLAATVSNSGGWQEVTSAAKAASQRGNSGSTSVEVSVQLTGSTLNGGDLSGMAEVDAAVTVVTSTGCVWVVNAAQQNEKAFGSKEIDLAFSVDLLETAVKGVDSDTVYQVSFPSDINFNTAVGVPLRVGNARQYATLYGKGAFRLTELCSTVVDDSGYAWFPVDGLDESKEYYIGINAAGADTDNAVIPDSLRASYSVDYGDTLTDAAGTKYVVGERESRWGITGKQFTIYVVVILGALVLITSGVMITLNKISKSKAKYAAMAADEDDCEIDEDALRLQIMQEMLEEAKRKNSGG